MTYEHFKAECTRLFCEIHNVSAFNLEADEDQLREFYEDGESPINVALACKPELESE